MAVKYSCAKCNRKFVDWGAEKLGFSCPDCEDSTLEIVNFEPAAKVKSKPTLKRVVAPKVNAIEPEVSAEDL